jgi:hypothetical protein
MNVTLQVELKGAGVFARHVSRPYPQVPRAGDLVWLADDQMPWGVALPVARVLWNNDGSVRLACTSQADGPLSESQLVEAGFTRIDDEVPHQVREALRHRRS